MLNNDKLFKDTVNTLCSINAQSKYKDNFMSETTSIYRNVLIVLEHLKKFVPNGKLIRLGRSGCTLAHMEWQLGRGFHLYKWCWLNYCQPQPGWLKPLRDTAPKYLWHILCIWHFFFVLVYFRCPNTLAHYSS